MIICEAVKGRASSCQCTISIYRPNITENQMVALKQAETARLLNEARKAETTAETLPEL